MSQLDRAAPEAGAAQVHNGGPQIAQGGAAVAEPTPTAPQPKERLLRQLFRDRPAPGEVEGEPYRVRIVRLEQAAEILGPPGLAGFHVM